MRALIIEDELYIAEPTEEILKSHHYIVDVAADGQAGLDFALTDVYDIILLDIMLPKIDGLTVLKKMRAAGIETPVIMLTAKSEIEDRITGLDLGADDYLPKPFDYGELLARMRVLIKRRATKPAVELVFGDLQLDPFKGQLTVKGEIIPLLPKEAQLLALLIMRKNNVTPKELIMDKLWDFDTEVDESNVLYHVSKLRKRLKEARSYVEIKAIRRVGYLLEYDDER